jgi:DNA-binding SARP family transcriptional activator
MPDVQGLRRQRVLNVLEATDTCPVRLLVAPAGAGKTTTLVQFGRTTSRTPAWYSAEVTDADPKRALAHLEHALCGVVEGLPGGWTDVEIATESLTSTPEPAPTVLLLDDLHELRRSSGERAIGRLLGALPPWLSVVAATRHPPDLNLTRLRVSGQLMDIPDDVLRWRTWEVERLFATFYGDRLRPEDAARLTQRTEGWAAGLQLFHLAGQSLPIASRTRLIDGLHTRPGLVRDYLAHNVIGGLSDELRTFLVDTCVLGRLNARLCDLLRDGEGSAELLGVLEAQRLFLVPREDGNGYRYHEVLRSYLEISLLERDGPAATRQRYQRAGQLLEAEGAIAEAVHANARGEAWGDVARLLGRAGPVLASGNGARRLSERLPPALVMGDPWLQLAEARALVADGSLQRAAAAYGDAKVAFGRTSRAQVCDAELAAVTPWIDPREHQIRGSTDLLRAAIRRDPARYAALAVRPESASGRLVGAVAMLLAGRAEQAEQLARAAGSSPDADLFVMAAGHAVEHATALMGGRTADPSTILQAAETFEQLGAGWLARVIRVVGSARARAVFDEARALGEVIERRADDLWGRPLLALVAGIASVVDGRPQPGLLEEAAKGFRMLDAGTLEAWALSWGALAVARSGALEPVLAAEQARSFARSVSVPGAELIAELAYAESDEHGGRDALLRAGDLARDLGFPALVGRPVRAPPVVTTRGRAPSHVQCFGGLQMIIHRRHLDLSDLKPQGRAVLALLAMEAGGSLHRDRLVDALWPEGSAAAGARKLPVLISTLRRYLEPETRAGAWTLLVRVGETYAIRVPDDAEFDLRVFDDAFAAAATSHRADDRDGEVAALQTAFDAYGGELLPEFGSAEWVVAERERYRERFIRVAGGLARHHLAGRDPDAAVEATTAGLRADRYRSRLWDSLVLAHQQAGDLAAAARAQAQHRAMLAELGLAAPATSLSGSAG